MMLITRLRALLQRRRVARELDDELAFHVEMETRANIARGMAPAEAKRHALAELGGVAQTKEAVHDVRALSIEALWQDVRHAVRTLAVAPGFTLTAAGMLALGIGITTAMFTVVDALILQPVPFRDPARLAYLWMGTDRGGSTLVAPAVVRAWRASPAFDAAESVVTATALIETGDTVAAREMATVTPGVFEMLGGVRPLRGRLFAATEGRAGEADRVLLSETVWRSLYGADSELIGRAITVDGERLTVVGILPADFRFPSSDTVLWRPADLVGVPGARVQAYVRFAADVPQEDALRMASAAAHAADPATAQLRPRVSPLVRPGDAYSSRAVPVLAGAVVLVFLALCANVSSLLLARLTARRREFSTRGALGASRGRLIRQALLESGVLGTLGVGAGAGLAWALVSIARAVFPEPLLAQTLNPLNLDARAMTVASIAGLLATLATGVLPAWLGTRADAGEALRAAERGTQAPAARTLTRALLVVEVALACTLLAGATLLTRSFVNLARADRGLDTSGVTTLWLSLASADAQDAQARATRARTIEDDLRQLPGVQQLAWSYGLPPGGGMLSFGDWIADLPGASTVNLEVERYVVSPEFFRLYGIPIVGGRGLESSDTFTTVVVSEQLARVLWGTVDPIGRSFRFQNEHFQVVGLAREIHLPSIDARLDRPEFYHPYTAVGTPMVSLKCATACPDAAVLRHRLAAAHPDVRVQSARPADQPYAAQLARPRASAALALAFAIISLLAAAGGLYSVLSYAVSRRRREFGIRAALGASPAQIRRVVFRDGSMVTVMGLAAGSLFAVLLVRALSTLQYGVTAGDPASLGVVVGTIGVTTLVAAWRPARTAARVDPARLLREE